MTRDLVHVLSGLERGGIETWLVQMLRTSPSVRERSVLVLAGNEEPTTESYADDVRQAGVPVVRVPFTRYALPFVRQLAATLKPLKPQFVHCHLNFMCGWALAAARLAGVPIRVAHYHSVYPVQHKTFLRRGYIAMLRAIENRFATHILGCSTAAHTSYAGANWQSDPRREVLYYGIDFSGFTEPVDRTAVRREFGLSDTEVVLGHVGRFVAVKNHALMLDIVARLAPAEPGLRLLLVGDGPLKDTLRQRAELLGIGERIIWAGSRADVARLMLGAMDAFIFPSHFEGLGIALIEAQAAGLPCIVSDVIPEEACVAAELVERLPLSAGVDAWASKIADRLHGKTAVSQAEAYDAVAQSRFQIENAVAKVEEFYQRASQSLAQCPSAWKAQRVETTLAGISKSTGKSDSAPSSADRASAGAADQATAGRSFFNP